MATAPNVVSRTVVKIAALVLGSTALYTYIGQLVPQKEVLPPPPAIELAADATPADLAEMGFEIAETKVAPVMGIAKQHQHPLLCTMEES